MISNDFYADGSLSGNCEPDIDRTPREVFPAGELLATGTRAGGGDAGGLVVNRATGPRSCPATYLETACGGL
jgi:hypothetical protein